MHVRLPATLYNQTGHWITHAAHLCLLPGQLLVLAVAQQRIQVGLQRLNQASRHLRQGGAVQGRGGGTCLQTEWGMGIGMPECAPACNHLDSALCFVPTS